jgi:predicted aconitase
MEKNKLWRVHVVELREVECIYTVEAPNSVKAVEYAHFGETVSEQTIGTIGVTDREIERIELINEQ